MFPGHKQPRNVLHFREIEIAEVFRSVCKLILQRDRNNMLLALAQLIWLQIELISVCRY